ncbi:MAG: DUF2771 family protein [Sciscionella sp.]
MRRGVLAIALAGAAIGLSACRAPAPTVSMFSGKTTIDLRPLQYCAQPTACSQNGAAAGRLDVRQGQPVQISVAGEIADAPWQVEYRMLDDQHHLSVGCSPLFFPNDKHYSFTVPPSSGTNHLIMVNVYEVGTLATASAHGSLTLFGKGTWTALTAPDVPLPKPGENLCNAPGKT